MREIQNSFLDANRVCIGRCANEQDLIISWEANKGSSDASYIYNGSSAEVKKRLFPFVMGPGCRSQRKLTPPRLTHGKNETFHKESGLKVVYYLLSVITELSRDKI